MAIINKLKTHSPKIKIIKDEYWDFIISSDISSHANYNGLTEKCLISYIDFNDNNCFIDNKFYSKLNYNWEGGINNGVELLDIGLTGIDNGFIQFRKDRISNNEYLNILNNSTFKIDKNDLRLFLTPVSGNTQEFSYQYEFCHDKDENFLALKGGFLQGFYKLFGFDYQVLPSRIENGWTLEFVLRKKNYEIDSSSINALYPSNQGIFFYIGTRSENKFWNQYNSNSEIFEDNNRANYNYDNYFGDSNFPLKSIDIINSNYFGEELKEDDFFLEEKYLSENDYINAETCCKDINEVICYNDTPSINKSYKQSVYSYYFLNEYGFLENSMCNNSSCEYCLSNFTKNENHLKDDEYYSDMYFSEDNENCCNKGFLVENEYYQPEISLLDQKIITKDDHEIDKNGYYEFVSDNKFLLFNNTPTGFTVNNWTEGSTITFSGRSSSFKPNYFLLMNNTKTGYTVNTLDEYLLKYDNTYDVINDITNNAFALKINDDNSIGYKYLILDCDSSNKFKIVEEKSLPNIINDDNWNVITIRIFLLNEDNDICPSNSKIAKRKMKLYFYVNGNLIFISKELPSFNFRELNDVFDKQEGIPFNISIGGGSQGLLETMWLNYYDIPSKILPIEKYFAGTFIGDIKSFKFYNCDLNYNEIKNNYLYENINKNV